MLQLLFANYTQSLKSLSQMLVWPVQDAYVSTINEVISRIGQADHLGGNEIPHVKQAPNNQFAFV